MRFLLIVILTFIAYKAVASPPVLIFGKTIRPAHQEIIPIAGSALVKQLSKQKILSEFTQDPTAFNKISKDIRAIILLDVSENVLSDSQKKSIETFYKNGGTLVTIHATIAAGKDWPWFRNLIGASFLDHSPIHSELVTETIPGSAIVKWTQEDEWYNFSETLPKSTLAVATIGKDNVISWVVGSHFFYTAMGHSSSLYTEPNQGFINHIVNGLKCGLKPLE